MPPIVSFYSNFIDVNNPNNTDPINLAQPSVLKALRPGVSLDSVQRLYTLIAGSQTNLTSQNVFTTSSSIGGQYVCRAMNKIGERNVTFSITVAREYCIMYMHTIVCTLFYAGAIGEFSPVYIRATAQFPIQFEGDLFFENVEHMLLQLINASSSGIETVSCSPATP